MVSQNDRTLFSDTTNVTRLYREKTCVNDKSLDFAKRLQDLRKVLYFNVFGSSVLKLFPKKYAFALKSINFLSHII